MVDKLHQVIYGTSPATTPRTGEVLVEGRIFDISTDGARFTIQQWDGGQYLFGPAPYPQGTTPNPNDRALVAFVSGEPWVVMTWPGAGAAPAATGGSASNQDVSSIARQNKAIALRLVKPYGWDSSSQWNALDKLWTRESSWDNTAQNPTSTAYGIAQFLDSTWADTGIAKTSDPTQQITAGLRYIKSRYGDPVTAWDHEVKEGWY